MDGDHLIGEPSDEHREKKSLTEIFKEAFPQYLAIGMTYDEYWHKEPNLVIDFRKADKMKLERLNFELWLQGKYNYEALLCVAPVMRATFSNKPVKPIEYPKEPHPITEEAYRAMERRKKIEAFNKIKAAMEAESKRTIKAEEEAKKNVEH